MEDPTFRRAPLFSVRSADVGGSADIPIFSGIGKGAYPNQVPNVFPVPACVGSAGCTYGSPVYVRDAAGHRIGYSFVDIAQREQVPDLVVNLRLDQAWGSAQLSGALHQVSIGPFYSSYLPGALISSNGRVDGATTQQLVASSGASPRRPDAAMGYALQAGVKLNLPMIAPGDTVWMQAAYGRGASSYVGLDSPYGADSAITSVPFTFGVHKMDGYVDPNTSNIVLNQSWSASLAYMHYWAPTLRSAVVVSYGRMLWPTAARRRGPLGDIYASNGGLGPITPASITQGRGKSAFNNSGVFIAAANLVWSPIKDLDIGIEGTYQRLNVSGRTIDDVKPYKRGGAGKANLVSSSDNWAARLRIDSTF